jgi:hypothetical protein
LSDAFAADSESPTCGGDVGEVDGEGRLAERLMFRVVLNSA